MDQESLIEFTPGINKVQSMMKQADNDSISINLSNQKPGGSQLDVQ